MTGRPRDDWWVRRCALRRTRVRLIDVVDEAMRWLPASIPGATTIQPGRGSTFRLELREAGAQG